MLFKTFIFPTLNSSVLAEPLNEDFLIKEALNNAFAEPFPLNVSVGFTNPLTNNIDNIVLEANKCTGDLYEILLPNLKCLENVHLSFYSANPKIPLMMDLLLPPNITPLMQNNLIDDTINFVWKNIVGPQKIFIRNKPAFRIENENIGNEINIGLTHFEGNQKINNRFNYIDYNGRIKNIKIINKLGYLNTNKITKTVLIKKILDKDLMIRKKKAKNVQENLKKALVLLKNINIRDGLINDALKTQIRPGCICEKGIEKNKKEKRGINGAKCILNICPFTQIECLKYGFNTTFNYYNILNLLLFHNYPYEKLFNNEKLEQKAIEKFLNNINMAMNVFEIRVLIQLFLFEIFDEFDYININIPYDNLRAKILQHIQKEPENIKNTEAKGNEKEEDDDETGDDDGEPSDDKKPKSRVILWVSLAVSGIVVIAIVGYLFMM